MIKVTVVRESDGKLKVIEWDYTKQGLEECLILNDVPKMARAQICENVTNQIEGAIELLSRLSR